jgi:hypothetical protein
MVASSWSWCLQAPLSSDSLKRPYMICSWESGGRRSINVTTSYIANLLTLVNSSTTWVNLDSANWPPSEQRFSFLQLVPRFSKGFQQTYSIYGWTSLENWRRHKNVVRGRSAFIYCETGQETDLFDLVLNPFLQKALFSFGSWMSHQRLISRKQKEL